MSQTAPSSGGKSGKINIAANVPGQAEILTPEALAFLSELEGRFGARVDELLEARVTFMNELKSGKRQLGFLPETEQIRKGSWKVSAIPADLQDRRVEITGPVERKMMINALNSGAKVFMADFEDSLTPGFKQVIAGQINCRDAVNSTISFKSPEGKEYKLNAAYPSKELAILKVRPRGWHLPEKHLQYEGKPCHGALVDFGLYFFHNAKTLVGKGTAPYFYLPKTEHYTETALWSEVFSFAEDTFGLKRGTIKATVLIETHTAAFEMDEILHSLKEHIVGQNAGRWDYIFSCIKTHSHEPGYVLPERGQIVMTQPALRAYSRLLIKTNHKRGAFAMGGMSAFIPVKNNEEANKAAFAQVEKDKEREAGDGHDGTWVAHPGLIPVAKAVFDRLMPTPNQTSKQIDEDFKAEQLLEVPTGTITEAGLKNNVAVSLRYLSEWLSGNGCVPIFNLMEDAATAEIARTQLWQWVAYAARLGEVGNPNEGEHITIGLVNDIIDAELAGLKAELGETGFKTGNYEAGAALLRELVESTSLDDFLTLKAYDRVA